jgi:hypothetical protein
MNHDRRKLRGSCLSQYHCVHLRRWH